MSNSQNSSDSARSAGRGGIAVLLAKAFFIVSGLIQQIVLPKLIGLDGYGAFSRVSAIANIANNVVVSSSIQGVSHSIASTPANNTEQTLRRTFKTHLAIAIPVALAFLFFAPVYASFQGAPHIIRPLQVVSIVVLFYGLYAPLVGVLNGGRRFTMQAGLDVIYAVLRTTGLLGLGWMFARGGDKSHGVLGACIGFACAAVIIFPVALKATGIGKSGSGGPTVKQHLMFILPVALGQVFLQLLMQSDIIILGHFASKLAATQLISVETAREVADKIVGVYRPCQVFAFLPFQMLITLTFIMFPMLAKAKAEQDEQAVANYVRTGMRLAFVFACLMVATVSALGPHLLHLMYSDEVAERGGLALRILAQGQGAFAIFYIETTVLTSLGRERVSAVLTGAAAVLVAIGCVLAGNIARDPSELLLYTASGTSVALVIAASCGAAMVLKVAKAYVKALTAMRTILTVAVVSSLGWFIPYMGRLYVIPQVAGIGLLAVVLLVATREVGKQDLGVVKQVLRRGG
ncbi:MAG: oligosaccharide flippase family protein [Polyangiaceae bacterium]|nr:oligosaccharide flippase family protein [Polyangiaceae bacterium]